MFPMGLQLLNMFAIDGESAPDTFHRSDVCVLCVQHTEILPPSRESSRLKGREDRALVQHHNCAWRAAHGLLHAALRIVVTHCRDFVFTLRWDFTRPRRAPALSSP